MSANPFRALCAELISNLQLILNYFESDECGTSDSEELIERGLALLAQPEGEDRSQISDGYHTFAELYEHRHALTLALMKALPRHCWFSRLHHDGELCFGDGEWFIVGAELPDSGEITYHLPLRLWGLAQLTGATELERGRPWDGHTAGDVVHRLKAWAAFAPLAQPEGEVADVLQWPAGWSRRQRAQEAELLCCSAGMTPGKEMQRLVRDARDGMPLQHLHDLISHAIPTPQSPTDAELADTHYEWELQDAEGNGQAGGSANSLNDVRREGAWYLRAYAQDGPHKLIIRQHTTQTIDEMTNG